MSMHRSLRRDVWKQERKVRKRYERLRKLMRTKKFIEGMSAYGLPKEKIETIKHKLNKMIAKDKQEVETKKELELQNFIQKKEIK